MSRSVAYKLEDQRVGGLGLLKRYEMRGARDLHVPCVRQFRDDPAAHGRWQDGVFAPDTTSVGAVTLSNASRTPSRSTRTERTVLMTARRFQDRNRDAIFSPICGLSRRVPALSCSDKSMLIVNVDGTEDGGYDHCDTMPLTVYT